MKKIIIFLGLVFMATLFSCESGSESKTYKLDNPNLREVVVKEVIHTTSYTYLKMKEEGDVYWGAVPRNDNIVEGKTYYFDNYMEMENFPSKELDRTFDHIYFMQSISDKPFPSAKNINAEKKGSTEVGNMEIGNIERIEGVVTIGELFENKSGYEGKTIKIHGQVVKFTPAVMNKNWVHIQDGTQSNGNFDLTVTTNDVVKKGDVVTFEGLVVLNKDFGYGYAYDILMEDAILVVE